MNARASTSRDRRYALLDAARDALRVARWSGSSVETARITSPTRHVRYGYSQSSHHDDIVHVVQSAAIYWPPDPAVAPFIATTWDCDRTGCSDAALLAAVPLHMPLCDRCDFAGVQRGERLIYFAAKDGLIKIGTSKRVVLRMHDLRSELLATTPGTVTAEYALHRRFSHLRVYGEWFRPGDDLIAFIADCADAMTHQPIWQPTNNERAGTT